MATEARKKLYKKIIEDGKVNKIAELNIRNSGLDVDPNQQQYRMSKVLDITKESLDKAFALLEKRPAI